MPEIAKEWFGSLCGNTSNELVVSEELGRGNVILNHEEGNAEEDGLKALAQVRGMFPLQDVAITFSNIY